MIKKKTRVFTWNTKRYNIYNLYKENYKNQENKETGIINTRIRLCTS